MNDIFENTKTMKENDHPRFYTAESVMRGHPDKLCDLIADSVLDECLKHDPASRVACEVMATHGHIIVAGEITTLAKPDVFNIVRDTLRDVGYDPKAYQIDCYIHDQSPDIAGAVEPELVEGEDEDTLGAGDQGVMVGYACNETPEYLPMPVVAAQRLVTLLEISRMTGVIPDIGPDGNEYEGYPMDGHDLLQYADAVDEAVKKDIADFNGDLMQYYHEDDSVRSKVVSAVPSVEIHGNKLCGCLNVELRESLNEGEQAVLCDYISGQYSDGWGEGFEQRDIRVEDGTLAVHFWQDHDFELKRDVPDMTEFNKLLNRPKKPKMQLIGQDGNIFAIMGRASRLLKNAGQSDKAKEMCDRVTASQSYSEALNIVSEYVETELSPTPAPKRDRGDAR